MATMTLRRKIALGLVALYVLTAVWVLVAFLRAPPDGLANIGTVLWTAPIAAIGVFLERWTGIGYPFMPSRFGYYGGHTIYFTLAVASIAAAVYRIIAGKRP